ncbi:MAG: hypothetical protein JNL96_03245 [Planctomycetaceae bacterium]|nr:hypothetical protein [Planctomycetaceae bacterium]
MAVKTLRLSELGRLSEAESEARLEEFGAKKPFVLNGEVEHLNSRIARLESRYEISSKQMIEAVKAGRMKETAEIGHWLMLLDMRDRLGRRRS